jgi:hypothetical protein
MPRRAHFVLGGVPPKRKRRREKSDVLDQTRRWGRGYQPLKEPATLIAFYLFFSSASFRATIKTFFVNYFERAFKFC